MDERYAVTCLAVLCMGGLVTGIWLGLKSARPLTG